MSFLIRPEPTAEEREAVEQALRAEAPVACSAWRRSGLDLGDETSGDCAPTQQLWRHPGIVEP